MNARPAKKMEQTYPQKKGTGYWGQEDREERKLTIWKPRIADRKRWGGIFTGTK